MNLIERIDEARTHYGFEAESPDAEYFVLHAGRDHEHAAASRKVLAEAPAKDANRLVAAAETALEGNWHLLDGVQARSG